MKRNNIKGQRAFTLIEMLVVIAIIGTLAGLVLHLGPGIHDAQRRKTVQAQMEQLTLLIEHYKEVKGFYPPGNNAPENAFLNTLYYELTGTNPPVGVDLAAFRVGGILNEKSASGYKDFFSNIKETQFYESSEHRGARFLGIRTKPPADGPAGFNNFCPWYYRPAQEGDATIHNPKGFDLWMRVELNRGPTIIGNWKDRE
jgi:prepilin-type N-terminal cleavage/methylation domain-containing protein